FLKNNEIYSPYNAVCCSLNALLRRNALKKRANFNNDLFFYKEIRSNIIFFIIINKGPNHTMLQHEIFISYFSLPKQKISFTIRNSFMSVYDLFQLLWFKKRM